MPGLLQEYGPTLALAARSDRFYVGWPVTYEIDALRPDGSPIHRIRAEVPPRPIGAAEREAVRAAALALDTIEGHGVRVQSSRDRLRELDRMIYPEHHPAYMRFEIDAAGNLWVARHFGPPEAPALRPTLEAGMTWDVFDRDGAWKTTVVTPGGFWPREFGVDRIAGVWRDREGVQYVRVYALRK